MKQNTNIRATISRNDDSANRDPRNQHTSVDSGWGQDISKTGKGFSSPDNYPCAYSYLDLMVVVDTSVT